MSGDNGDGSEAEYEYNAGEGEGGEESEVEEVPLTTAQELVKQREDYRRAREDIAYLSSQTLEDTEENVCREWISRICLRRHWRIQRKNCAKNTNTPHCHYSWETSRSCKITRTPRMTIASASWPWHRSWPCLRIFYRGMRVINMAFQGSFYPVGFCEMSHA